MQSLAIVIVLVVAAIAGIAFTLTSQQPTTTQSSTQSTKETTLTTTQVITQTATQTTTATATTTEILTSTSTTQATTATHKAVDTLGIDEWIWTIDDLNQLYAEYELPWPNWLTYTVYQPLVSVDEVAQYGNGTIRYLPGLASWTVSSDGTTYTFDLRQNVKFSNGDPLNAYQVWAEMYGFYYLSGNSTTWLESYNFFDMSHVKFGSSSIALLTSSGLINPSPDALKMMSDTSWPIYVTGPNQIVFQLRAPFQWFPGTLIVFNGLIFDVQFVLQHGGFGTPTQFNSYFNQNPIPGTGPYTVTEVSQNAFVKFQQDPNYWGRGLSAAEIAKQPIWDSGHVKNVIVYYKPDNIARYADLANDVVQIAAIQPSAWNLVTSNPEYSYLKLPSWAGEVSLMGLNTHLYPTNITAVRQAVVHAINYTDIYQKAYLGQMSPYVGPEYPAWKDFYNLGGASPYKYDLDLAKQYLAQANIKDMPTFLFRVVAGCESCINAAQVVQSNLADIGIIVTVEVVQSAQYYAYYGNYQTNVQNSAQLGQLSFVNSGFGWSPATLTPADYWVTFVNEQSVWGNWAGYSHPVVQKCVDGFTTTADLSALKTLCTAAQKQINDDAPYAWIGTFGLWSPPGGSLVWKNTIVKSFMVDPVWNGETDAPIFNTVIFA